jgi:hypothetical protein
MRLSRLASEWGLNRCMYTCQAVLWGVDHGFTPDHSRIEHWRGGP